MFFELLLLSVVVATAYLGPMILRRFGPHQRTFGLMLVTTLVLALVSLISTAVSGHSAEADTIGAVAIGAAVCLILLPPMVRDLGRRALAGNHLRVARILSDLRELLQPGMCGRQESELVATILAVRNGRESEIIEALEERRRQQDDPRVGRMIEERIIMTFLYAQRWADAVERYERLSTAGHRPASPQLSVEMVRAYCEEDQLGKAAELLQIIEESPVAKEPLLLSLLSRARLFYLAFLGRTGAVESLVGPTGPLSRMPEAARNFWFGIAKLNAGDAKGARSSLREAARLAADDPRAQEVAQRHLDRVDLPGQMGPHSVSIEVAELADRLSSVAGQASKGTAPLPLESAPSLPRVTRVPLRLMPLTVALALITAAASLAIYLAFGNMADMGVLIASGANIKSATLHGEWWRLGSSLFLHLGVAHLALNLYGLWVLGRMVEQMYGGLRTLVIYLLSGLIGALASTYLGESATSLGASAGVLGLMGAALAEFASNRDRYPNRWVRSLFGTFLVMAVAQLAIGFFYVTVDHWSLLAGLVGGAIVGAMLSPLASFAIVPRRVLGAVVATAAVVFFCYAGFSIATTSYTDSLRSYERAPQVIGGLSMLAPSSWEKISERQLHDPGIGALLDFRRLPAEPGLDATISARLESEHFGGALRAGFDRAKPSARSRLNLPAPWRGGELDVSVDASAGPQRYRLVVFGRVVDDEVWLGAYYHPAALTEAIQPVFGEVLATVRAARTADSQPADTAETRAP